MQQQEDKIVVSRPEWRMYVSAECIGNIPITQVQNVIFPRGNVHILMERGQNAGALGYLAIMELDPSATSSAAALVLSLGGM